MKYLLYILIFLSANLLGQNYISELPDKYNTLVLKQTTIKDVSSVFGKPDNKISCKTCGCIKHEFAVKTYNYKKLGMRISFERSTTDKTYKISWIEFTEPCTILFGKSTKIGSSTSNETFEDIGVPSSQFDNPTLGMTAQYHLKEKNIRYIFQFDLKTKILKTVTIQDPGGLQK